MPFGTAAGRCFGSFHAGEPLRAENLHEALVEARAIGAVTFELR